MKLPISQRAWSSIGVAALVLMLGLLALLQYRWSRDVSEAAGARMRASLQSSMMRFREDFTREVGNLAGTLQTDSESPYDSKAARDYVQRIDAWKRVAAHPELLQNVYVFERSGEVSRLLRLNFQKVSFEPSAWPLSLDRLKEPLSLFSSDIPFLDHHHRDILQEHIPNGPLEAPRGSHITRDQFFFRMERDGGGRSGPPNERHEHVLGPDAPGPGRPILPRLPWMFDEGSTVLMHLQITRGPEGQPQPAAISWIIIELNENVIREQIFPQLAQAHFSGADGLEYDVAVVDRSRGDNLVYASSAAFRDGNYMRPDAEVPLVGSFDGPPGITVGMAGPARTRPEATYLTFPGAVRVEHFRFMNHGLSWVLMAKHRKGSLEAALASMHRRQLAISFGVLALLGVTMAMIIVATRRAQRLAKLQMDFVAGVSHELRTPLAVIGSAAENIADGIIEDKSKLRRYGAVIRDQSRHLTQLVEQILLFAAARQNGYKFNLAPTKVAEIVRRALDGSSGLIQKAGITVEQQVEPDLPQVMVDLPAVTHCLQNLITNAIKYGGESRWMRVSAKALSEKIEISVEDKGIGISNSDVHRIFDPFYRSPEATTAQIHGTGLGLAIAKGIADAMGGRLSVQSELGRGSTFTLHLPAIEKVTDEESKDKAELNTIR